MKANSESLISSLLGLWLVELKKKKKETALRRRGVNFFHSVFSLQKGKSLEQHQTPGYRIKDSSRWTKKLRKSVTELQHEKTFELTQ